MSALLEQARDFAKCAAYFAKDAGYERFTWATIGREVSKFRVCILGGEPLPLATSEIEAAKRWRNVVTPMGLEPWHRVTTRRMKTATSHDLA